MNSYAQVSLLFFCLKIALTWGYNVDELYSIQAVGSNNLVLDASDPNNVKLEYFNGFNSQLWKITNGPRPGVFYIINNREKKALDFNKAQTYNGLMLSPKSNSVDQQWIFNANGRIVSAAKPTYHVVPARYEVKAANIVHLWQDNNGQEFVLKKKD